MSKISAFPAGDLFNIRMDDLNIGNYKYGNLKRIAEEDIFKSKDPLFSLELEQYSDEAFGNQEETMFFYGLEGKQDVSHVVSRRGFPLINDGFMELKGLNSNNTKLCFNKQFRRYSLTKLSKAGTIGENLADITTLKLLDHDKLSFHGGCVKVKGRGFVITGLPDVGKTYSTMELLRRDDSSGFLAEDILVTDANNLVYSVPFTQTVEKRRALSASEKIGSYVYNSFIRHNYIKSDVMQAMPGVRDRIVEKTDVEAIFFLKRGREKINKIVNKDGVIDEFVRLNNLEFGYSRNVMLLSSLYFNRGMGMVDYLNKERDLIAKFVKNLDVYEIYAERPEKYADIIQKYI